VQREPAIFRHPSAALIASAALLVLLAALTVVVSFHHRLAIDDIWARWMRDFRTSAFTDLSKGLNRFGGFFVQLVIRLAIAVVLVVRSWWKRLAAWAFVALLGSPICDTMKAMVARPRPAGGLVHAGGASFPSGHAAAAAVTAIGLVLALSVPGRARIAGAVIAGVYIVAMAWSRAELGVHWLSDVAAGVALGSALTLGAFAAADLIGTRSRTPSEPAPAAAVVR
jgi:undecaprenyl-diphosphatase